MIFQQIERQIQTRLGECPRRARRRDSNNLSLRLYGFTCLVYVAHHHWWEEHFGERHRHCVHGSHHLKQAREEKCEMRAISLVLVQNLNSYLLRKYIFHIFLWFTRIFPTSFAWSHPILFLAECNTRGKKESKKLHCVCVFGRNISRFACWFECRILCRIKQQKVHILSHSTASAIVLCQIGVSKKRQGS